jgi:CBS domain-containing protein
VPAVAVVDAAEALCGLITAPDLLAARKGWTAVDAMSSAHAVSANTSIEAVADVMARERYEHVVVTDDAGQVVGVVSARDVARHCCGY